MKTFAYDVTLYPLTRFKELSFICSEEGTCAIQETSAGSLDLLVSILNERGREGWELVELISRPSGLVAIWKREEE